MKGKYSGINLNNHSVQIHRCPKKYICLIEKIFQRLETCLMQERYHKVLIEVQDLVEFHIFQHNLVKRGIRATRLNLYKYKVKKAYNKNFPKNKIEKVLAKF